MPEKSTGSWHLQVVSVDSLSLRERDEAFEDAT